MEHYKEGGSPTPHEQGSQGAPGREIAAAVAGAELFRPNYLYTPRLVGRLALGELVIEPILGPVRVAGVRQPEEEEPDGSHVFVSWRDEHGPGHAAGRYPADRSFDVRMPAHEDRFLVRRGIDKAVWLKQEITNDVARLIASHLHPGEHSSLHAFMIDGSIDEGLYDELDEIAAHRQYAREWVDALARYCLAREDTGPITSWTRQAMAEAEERADEWLLAGGVNLGELEAHLNGNANSTGHRNRGTDNKINGNSAGTRDGRLPSLLSRKHIQTDMAARLIDAAFTLGVEAGRSGTTSRVRLTARGVESSEAA